MSFGRPRKAEAVKLPGAGISTKQCPRKCVAEKGYLTDSGKIALGRSPNYVCGKLGIARRSSLLGSFTTLHSSLKIIVARVLAS